MGKDGHGWAPMSRLSQKPHSDVHQSCIELASNLTWATERQMRLHRKGPCNPGTACYMSTWYMILAQLSAGIPGMYAWAATVRVVVFQPCYK